MTVSEAPAYLRVGARAALAHEAAALMEQLSGRFYTPPLIGGHLSRAATQHMTQPSVRIIDPFAGDGRLIDWFVRENHRRGFAPPSEVVAWDLDDLALSAARKRLAATSSELGLDMKVRVRNVDAFEAALTTGGHFDVVITNPPWENLKPDRRLLSRLNVNEHAAYIEALRCTDLYLRRCYPNSQPSRKFAGWGTNLARVGIEASWRLLRNGGVLAVVSPASFLADDVSVRLREHLLSEGSLCDVAYFPAEARCFDADVTAVAAVFSKREREHKPLFTSYDHHGHPSASVELELGADLARRGWSVPVGFGATAAETYSRLRSLPTLGSLESKDARGLWAGRELDETRLGRHLSIDDVNPNFVKGFMIRRFGLQALPTHRVVKQEWSAPPESSRHVRIAWRDVSRPNQKRRVQATLIPADWIAGNSLGVAYFRDDDLDRLALLLGIVSSAVFEVQLRAFLATGHVTLSSLRRVHIPELFGSLHSVAGRRLIESVHRCLRGDLSAEPELEAHAANLYGLDKLGLDRILRCFPKITLAERDAALACMTPP